MGRNFVDQYSLLHFSVGVVMFFWGVPFWYWFFVHLFFEIIENTQHGIKFINTTLHNIWPGGKDEPDSIINMCGDQTFAMLGWLVAYYVNDIFV